MALDALAVDAAFAGREWDEDAGLSYNRARWYDAELGRFLSEDPIGLSGGDANVYRYAAGDPANYRDPSGLYFEGYGGLDWGGSIFGSSDFGGWEAFSFSDFDFGFGEGWFDLDLGFTPYGGFGGVGFGDSDPFRYDPGPFRLPPIDGGFAGPFRLPPINGGFAGYPAAGGGFDLPDLQVHQLDFEVDVFVPTAAPTRLPTLDRSSIEVAEPPLDAPPAASTRTWVGYLNDSLDQVVYGHFSSAEPTWLGVRIQVAASFTGADIAADIRDISHDVINWEWTWEHASNFAFNTAGLLPVVGVAKHGDEVVELTQAARRTPSVVAPDTVAERLRIQNKAQQARDTAPTRGLGGRSLTPAQRSELNTFAEKARARGYTENPNRTGSFGEIIDGKFKERVRIDIGDPSQPGWRGKTHLNFPGDRGHYSPDTPLP
ncbi:MAG: RHS repeat-associated core domain-containing protein [Planctomycetota bacterium]